MQRLRAHTRFYGFGLLILLLAAGSGFAQDNGSGLAQGNNGGPPDEAGPGVARISLVNGDVSVRRGDGSEAVAAAPNAPLLAQDVIAAGPGARAEVQFDFANRFRIGNDTEARIANIEAGKYHVELARGTATISVLRDSSAQVELSTPNVSVHPLKRGLYRAWVREDGQTVVTVRNGEAEIYSQHGTEHLGSGQTMFVRGNADDPEFQVASANQTDEWDVWNEQRDQSLDRVQSYKYVNPDMYGVEDLDSAGTWTNDPSYGNVWQPRVDPGWSPYSVGRWAWEDYYGWTWVSADPWGWAPYHYGSWYYGHAGWCWYPGAFRGPVFWRPALVAFFGWGGFGVGLGFGGWGNVGWVPLAPYEAFHPWYGRGWFGGWGGGYGGWGRGGYRNTYITNVNINRTNITNIYRNAQVNGAVRGVSANAFTSGQFTNISRVGTENLRQAGLVRGALPATPTTNNLRYTDRRTSISPQIPNNARFTSRAPSPAIARTSFTQQQQAVQQMTQRSFQPGGNRTTAALPANQPGARFAQPSASVNRATPNANSSASFGRGTAGNSGWGGFGTPNRAAVTPSTSTVRPTAPASPSQNNASWGRFGSPSQNARAPEQAYRQQSATSPAWNRFGSGASTAGASGYQRYNGNANAATNQRGFVSNPSQSLRISPPIVHDRSYDQPSRSSASSFGSGTYRQPTTSTPRYENPSYSSPRTYSTPSYSAPRTYSSPSYNAPRNYSSPSYNTPRSYSSPSYSAPRSYGSSPSYSAPRSSGGSSYHAPSYSAPRSSSGGGSHASASSGGSHGGGDRRR